TTMAQERDVEAADDRPLLAGPQVQEERLPGVESGFTMERGESARMGGQPVPPQAFRAALSSLMAEDAPMTVRISPEQRERIMAHVREFESKARGLRDRGSRGQRRAASEQDRRAGVEDRAAKRRDAGRQAPEAVEEGRRGRRGQSDARPEDAMASGEQRAVMARAMADLQHRIWAELSSAQQAHVGTQIEEYRARAEEQRAGQLRERYRKEIGQRFDEAEQQRGGAARQRDRGGVNEGEVDSFGTLLADLPEPVRDRVSRRLENLSEERRAALLERIRNMSPEQRQRLVQRLTQGGADTPNQRRQP
ncbi:MAG: hypothetical protein HRU13_09360, partial [Phycisphaerales bacterium]|nr:hypothetical protein [Phycisphaerales bacterium]